MAFQGRIGRFLPPPVRRAARDVHHALHLSRGTRLGQRARIQRPGLPLGVLGLHGSVLGLGQGARLFLAACRAAGIEAGAVDVSGLFALDRTLPVPAGLAGPPGTLVAHLNPVELLYAIGRLGRRFPLAAHRIGYWAWETTRAPDEWKPGAAIVDAIWCPSRFTASALCATLGTDRPVHVVPHPVGPPPACRPDKARFGLDPSATTLLCAFDIQSSPARKNPMGAIEAFARSGCGADGSAQLLVKLHGRDPDGSLLERLRVRIAGVPGIVLLTERLQSADMELLQASTDIVLSAHRAEGFGLVLAEAMAAGRTVIATGWSGNMDFMDDSCAAPVASRLVPVADPSGVYRDGSWAEPDLDHMASLIRTLVPARDRRAALGEAARARVAAWCGPQAWQARVSALLDLPDGPGDRPVLAA